MNADENKSIFSNLKAKVAVRFAKKDKIIPNIELKCIKNKFEKTAVDKWAEYVKTHADKDWPHQQNIIINSSLKSASMTKEQFLKMKGEKHFQM